MNMTREQLMEKAEMLELKHLRSISIKDLTEYHKPLYCKEDGTPVPKNQMIENLMENFRECIKNENKDTITMIINNT